MTDFNTMMESHPPAVRDAVRRGLGMSVSQARLWLGCALAGKYQYIDRVERPEPRRIMVMGSLFDYLCNTMRQDKGFCDIATGLDTEDINTVLGRYDIYADHINYDADQLQVPVYRDCDPITFYGFADRDKDGTHELLIDHKFSLKPWPNNKPKKHAVYQAQSYLWAATAMWGAVPRFEYHVLNAETPDIQIIPYKPRQSSIDAVPTWLLKAYEIKRGGVYPAAENSYRCDWCDYKGICPKVKEETETQTKLQAALKEAADFDAAFDM